MCINNTELTNWITTLSALATVFFAGATIVCTYKIHINSEKNRQKESLDKQLIELQRMSFYDPFLEDENFTKQWDSLRGRYLKNELSGEELHKFLKYDVYTEMLFNFLVKSFKVYKKEDVLLNYVDFKSWLRTHSECWQNPLQEHSNREVYGKEIFDMVEDWLK